MPSFAHVSTSKTPIRLRSVRHLSSRPALKCIKVNTTEGSPNDFGTKETDIVLPSPPPQWFWEQGEMPFCSIFGIKPTIEQVFPVRAS